MRIDASSSYAYKISSQSSDDSKQQIITSCSNDISISANISLLDDL